MRHRKQKNTRRKLSYVGKEVSQWEAHKGTLEPRPGRMAKFEGGGRQRRQLSIPYSCAPGLDFAYTLLVLVCMSLAVCRRIHNHKFPAYQ